MNKPLTIEELKALEVGEWVWIVPSNDIFTPYYGQINKYTDRPFDEELWVNSQTNIIVLYYSDYGKTWLAYKNKEAAEGKDDEIRKEVAKEILQQLIEWNKRETPLIADIQELAEKYNVEVEE